MHPEVISAVREHLAESHGVGKVISQQPVGGGSINDAWLLQTDRGPFFIKLNSLRRYPGMFPAEARGLALLASANCIRIPNVVATGESDDTAFILLEYLGSSSPSASFWQDFGIRLAALHRNSYDHFGLDHSNYIGSLPQENSPCDSWNEFFITRRLEPMARMARDSGLFESSLNASLQRLSSRLEDIFPEEPPSLLHGDLWSGNYMTGPEGEPCIIDPAVYYGFREMDIGMSKLFGGFSHEFYGAYNEGWPMEPGWEQRLDICNLYPLLVHVNLFGSGYLGQVRAVLSRF